MATFVPFIASRRDEAVLGKSHNMLGGGIWKVIRELSLLLILILSEHWFNKDKFTLLFSFGFLRDSHKWQAWDACECVCFTPVRQCCVVFQFS